MDPKFTVEEFCNLTKELLQKNAYKTDAYIRPQVYKNALKICF